MKKTALRKVGKKKAAKAEAEGRTIHATIEREAPIGHRRRSEEDGRGEFTRIHPIISPERRAFNARVKLRDGHCLLCGGRAEEAHHLIKVGSHPELELIDANGMACCRWCHREDADAIHPNNETKCRMWRAARFPAFAAIYDAGIDKPYPDWRERLAAFEIAAANGIDFVPATTTTAMDAMMGEGA